MFEFRHNVLDVGAVIDPGHVPGVLGVDGGENMYPTFLYGLFREEF